METLEMVELVERELAKVTNIGANLGLDVKRRIMEFLKRNLDVFAWTHEDMLGI